MDFFLESSTPTLFYCYFFFETIKTQTPIIKRKDPNNNTETRRSINGFVVVLGNLAYVGLNIVGLAHLGCGILSCISILQLLA